jgi:glycosyltransferase involved in cell wall biosynthesis
MHVLMTTDAVGGVWDYAIELVRALRSVDIRVTLACLGPPPRPHHYAALANLGEVELELREGRLEWMDDCEDDLARAGEWLLELEQRLAPDLVHLNGYAHAALPWRAPTILVAHSCVPSWWRAVHGESAPARYNGYRARVQAGLSRAETVVAPSAWMLAQLLGYRVRFQGTVIHNARRASEYPPGPKCGLILAAGRLWDPAKNLAALDWAAAATGTRRAMTGGPGALPWPIVVAGDTRAPNGSRPAPSSDRVERLGALSAQQLAWWMAHAAIFAHPVRYEPFGLAPLEAGLSGCALVLGDIPSLRELWADAAVYVDPDDPPGLARTLHALIDDPARRAQLGQRARVRAQRYSVARMLAGYHDLYRELVHGHGHGHGHRRSNACAS